MAETTRIIAFALAEAFLRGSWEANGLADRAISVLVPKYRPKWIRSLTRRVMIAFHGHSPPRLATLIRFLEQDERFIQIVDDIQSDDTLNFEIDFSQLPRPEMQPAAGAASNWPVRPLVTTNDVGDWLRLTPGELDWFAECRHRSAKQTNGRLSHYRYRWITKTSGGRRLLEIPKPRLKALQRKILDEIVAQIPPHPAAHAYRRGRSIASCVAPHACKRIIIYTDLREFFPSVRASQVHAIFRTAGYPERVASLLTGVCTHMTPHEVFTETDVIVSLDRGWIRYGSPHLPQGAPTSPALANLASFWLDCRLTGLARKVGADYTRYADDLVFSGDAELARCASRFRVLVAAIVHHEGFEIRQRKTREMRSGTRQQVGGITINQHPNIPRQEYDALRATLHNCLTHGPETQNIANHSHFREHLQGRLAYWSTICPARAGKLKAMFDRIIWLQ